MSFPLPNPDDPSNPGLPAPLFADVTAVRGDVLRAFSQLIWGNFEYLEDNFDAKAKIAAIAAVLTGYSVGSNAVIAATDTILQAFGKTQGQINALAAFRTLPVAFTPVTQGIGSPTINAAFSNQNGSWLEGFLDVTFGAVTGSELRIGFGFNGTAGNVTASTNLPGVSIQQINVIALGGSIATKYTVLMEPGASYFTFGYADLTPITKRNGNAFGGAGDRLIFQFRVPIEEWE